VYNFGVAEIKAFLPVKLVCGIISTKDEHFRAAEEKLASLYGPLDSRSPRVDFDLTDYYERDMGAGLQRSFISFSRLIDPVELSRIKVRTNLLEEEIRSDFSESRRVVNLDPGYLTRAALIMATAKDFSHRIPLRDGIYGHLEFLFAKGGIRRLDWTYPDLVKADYQGYFLAVRKIYLDALKSLG
jgi:hypothetical protein